MHLGYHFLSTSLKAAKFCSLGCLFHSWADWFYYKVWGNFGEDKTFFFWDHICSYTFGKVLVYLLVQRGVNQSSLCTIFAAGTGIFSSSVKSIVQQDPHTALQRGGKLIFVMPWSTIFGVRESWCTEKPFCESGLKCTLWNLNCQNPWLFTHTLKINVPGFANFIDEWSQCDFCLTNFGVILEYLDSSIRLSSTWSWHV